jgi:phosphate acetyltransferase
VLGELTATAADPLFFGNLLVNSGQADGSVAGATNTTARTVQAALQCIGIANGHVTASSFFLMEFPHKREELGHQGTLLFADCGVVIDPSALQLSDIAITTASSAHALLDTQPHIALLSFSTKGSASHAHVDRIREAHTLADQHLDTHGNPHDIVIDGELQLDAAVVPHVAASKAPMSKIGGRANVLIFPDLNSGNIAYKIAHRFADAMAIGPILQGLELPANDLSRGCSMEDVVDATVITVLQAHEAAERRGMK